MNRRLAAILAADVEGFSRHVGEDEEGTARALRQLHDSIQPVVAEQSGRLIDTAGDSILAEFQSAAAAVTGAVAIQRAWEQDRDPSARRLRLRIGITQGDVVDDEGRVFGDGVNVAARLQALADPGGVTVSDRVHEDVSRKLELRWRDGGTHVLKNIERPVRVWHWSGDRKQGHDSPLPLERLSVVVKQTISRRRWRRHPWQRGAQSNATTTRHGAIGRWRRVTCSGGIEILPNGSMRSL